MRWDGKQRTKNFELAWTSKAQATQRRGRTGRTNDGVVFRMIPTNLYAKLPQYETPAIQLVSLEMEVFSCPPSLLFFLLLSFSLSLSLSLYIYIYYLGK